MRDRLWNGSLYRWIEPALYFVTLNTPLIAGYAQIRRRMPSYDTSEFPLISFARSYFDLLTSTSSSTNYFHNRLGNGKYPLEADLCLSRCEKWSAIAEFCCSGGSKRLYERGAGMIPGRRSWITWRDASSWDAFTCSPGFHRVILRFYELYPK